MFQDSVCELKRTTKIKFLDYCNECNTELIATILKYAAYKNANSFEYFDKIMQNVLKNNITTVEEFNKSIEEFRSSKKQIKQRSSKQTNKIQRRTFNNFEPREYDYDELERKLLGWD